MRIGIFGGGALGGFLAARLWTAGADVVLVTRGARLDAVRSSGITILSGENRTTVRAPSTTDDPRQCGPVDIVIVGVKMPDFAETIQAIRPMMGLGTAVLPFQNGIDAPRMIAESLGARSAMMGAAYAFLANAEPGTIRLTGNTARFFFGELDGCQSKRTSELRDILIGAGLEAPVPTDMRVQLWEKFIFLAAMAGVTAASRSPLGIVRADAALRSVFVRAVAEVAALARAAGIQPEGDSEAAALAIVDRAPADATSSLAKDLAAGRRLENAWLSGAIVRLGLSLGVPTPVHEAINAFLRPFEAGGRQSR